MENIECFKKGKWGFSETPERGPTCKCKSGMGLKFQEIFENFFTLSQQVINNPSLDRELSKPQ